MFNDLKNLPIPSVKEEIPVSKFVQKLLQKVTLYANNLQTSDHSSLAVYLASPLPTTVFFGTGPLSTDSPFGIGSFLRPTLQSLFVSDLCEGKMIR